MRNLAATTLELVSIPSVTKHEEPICDHVERWASRLGEEVRVRRVGNGLVVSPAAPSQRPAVGLFGHLDTVLPSPDQACEIRGGRLYGCGASDMKAGLAVMMALHEERARWACDLVTVYYDREEGPAAENGLEDLRAHLPRLDLAVMLEPTANRLQLGCVGGLHARLHFDGRRAHSARPWQGDNAMYHAIPVLERLRRRQRREVVVDGLPFYEVMTPTMAWTSNSANVVPDAFVVNVNFRYAPGRTAAAAEEELRALVGADARVEVVDVAPSGAVCRDQPMVARWIARHQLAVESKQAWTDVARMTAHGVPAVNFGPGDPAQAHQAGEWVAVEAIAEGYRLLADLLEHA